jgi:hypothetical protein
MKAISYGGLSEEYILKKNKEWGTRNGMKTLWTGKTEERKANTGDSKGKNLEKFSFSQRFVIFLSRKQLPSKSNPVERVNWDMK